MDSRSHTNVARCLLDYMEQTEGVEFNRKAFYFGNLKPDLKGEYLSKRHYPSLMFDEVMDKLRAFIARFRLAQSGTRSFSEALGEICHYITDFFSYPHNDTIYNKSLLAHYIYEKRAGFRIKSHVNEQRFAQFAETASDYVPETTEELISAIKAKHEVYTGQKQHGISDDIRHICEVLVMVVGSVLQILRGAGAQPMMRVS